MQRTFSIVNKRFVESQKNILMTHYSKPTLEEYQDLVKDELLSEEFIEGLKDEHELSRVEYGKYPSLLIQIPYATETTVITIPFGFILRKKQIVTVCEKEVKFLDKLFNLKIEGSKATDIFLEMLFLIEEEYERTVKVLTKKIRQKKTNLSMLANNDIMELVELEDTLNNLITSASPNVLIYEKIAHGKIAALNQSELEYFHDVQNNAKQNVEQTRLLIKTVQSIRNAYSTIMSNNLNSVMKILTSATIILAIPTLVAALYGMNVGLPYESNPFAFAIVLLMCIILMSTVSIIFVVKKWF